MKIILTSLSLALALSACAPDASTETTSADDVKSDDLREAVEKPIGATYQAVDQARATQDRLDATLKEMNSGSVNEEESSDTSQQE